VSVAGANIGGMTHTFTTRLGWGRRLAARLRSPGAIVFAVVLAVVMVTRFWPLDPTVVTVLWLIPLGAVIVVGILTAVAAPQPPRLGDGTLLVARLLWLGKLLWGTTLLVVSGFVGAVMGLQLEAAKEAPAGAGSILGDTLWPLLGTAVSLGFALLAYWLPIDLLRLRHHRRRRALLRAVITAVAGLSALEGSRFGRSHARSLARSPTLRAWVAHLTAWGYVVLLAPALVIAGVLVASRLTDAATPFFPSS
jgi:hypothetical protein